MSVRVKRDIDLRRFPPLAQVSRKLERLYKNRTAVGRVSGRLKAFWGADDGNINGSHQLPAQVGSVPIVQDAFATLLLAGLRTGTFGQMNLGPISKALQKELIVGRASYNAPPR